MTNSKNLLIIAAVLLLAGAVVFAVQKQNAGKGQVACTMEAKLCPDGTAVGRTGPSCEFAACPGAQDGASFGVAYTLTVAETKSFSDGLGVTLKEINDSRCKSGVQCIWAGELVPTLSVTGGVFGATVQEIHLGTTTHPSATAGAYTFVLNSATETTATVTVTKNTGGRIAAGYASGHVTIGPFCPVEQVGHPCAVPPEAYTSRSVIVYESNGTTVKEKVALDADGNYKIALGPGTYYLQIEPAGIGAGEKKKVTIVSFETSTVDFDIDTGIR